MNTQHPLLPETTFKPLSPKKLEAMIDFAVAQPQLPRTNNVVAFRRPWMFGTGMAAMAASILLTFMLTPQFGSNSYGSTSVAMGTESEASLSADVSDLILLDSLGA